MKNNFKIRVFNAKENKYHFVDDMATAGSFLVLAGMNPNGDFRIDRFTGTKDSKGNDIYENDKIYCRFQKNSDRWYEMSGYEKGVVEYDNKLCQFRVFFTGRNGAYDSQTLERHYNHVVVEN